MRRTVGLLLATVLSTSALAAAPAAAAPADSPRLQQSADEAGTTTVRPRSHKRPLTLRRPRALAPVSAPRTVVAAPAEVVPAVEAQPTAGVVTAPAQTLPTGTHAFLNVDGGAVTRWNPCQPVPWQFNPAGAPAGGLEVVQAAMATLADKTGLPLQYQGTVGTTPSATYLAQTWGSFKPLLVGWTSPLQSDLLAGGDATLVGMARILWTGSYDADGRNHTQIASGVVALNRTTTAGTSGAGSWYTFVLHELGHAVGLGHVDDNEQIMRASIPMHLATYGSGDLEGLRAVGSTGGCLPNIR